MARPAPRSRCLALAESEERRPEGTVVATPAGAGKAGAGEHRPELPAALAEELGRILGEALVIQYQRDSGAMVGTSSGINHTAEKPR